MCSISLRAERVISEENLPKDQIVVGSHDLSLNWQATENRPLIAEL